MPGQDKPNTTATKIPASKDEIATHKTEAKGDAIRQMYILPAIARARLIGRETAINQEPKAIGEALRQYHTDGILVADMQIA